MAAYEFKRAGYESVILEVQNRPVGRAWSVYGCDRYTDTDGIEQVCEFDKGQFFNLMVKVWFLMVISLVIMVDNLRQCHFRSV